MNSNNDGFWKILVGVGTLLIIVGIILIIIRPGGEAAGPLIIDVFGAKFEGSDVGLMMIALGLATYIIALKDRSDERKYKQIEYRVTESENITKEMALEIADEKLTRVKQEPSGWTPDFEERKLIVDELEDEVRKAKKQAREDGIDLVKMGEIKRIRELSKKIDEEEERR